jgi:hypothetical protein
MTTRRRARPRTRWPSRALRNRLRSKAAALVSAPRDLVRFFGWLYVAVLVPVLLVLAFIAARQAMAGGDVVGSLQMLPLAIIWPLAAVALHGQSAAALVFPLNILVLTVCTAFVISGWTVLIWAVRDLVRWRAAR